MIWEGKGSCYKRYCTYHIYIYIDRYRLERFRYDIYIEMESVIAGSKIDLILEKIEYGNSIISDLVFLNLILNYIL